MFHDTISKLFRSVVGPPSFRVYGKGQRESDWHVIDIYTTHRRDMDSRWPLFRGTCITWTSSIISVGCDFAAELIREQLMLRLDQELPYATTVEIEQFNDRPDGIAEIHAIIWVERDGQKAIVIGNGGSQLKAIGTSARRHMERMFERKVFLKLWVKVREGWVDDENMLRKFGYTD